MAFGGNQKKVIVPVLNDLDATAGDVWTEIVKQPIHVSKVEFVMTEATDGAVATNAVISADVINFDNPSRTEIVTATVPDTAPVGTVLELTSASGELPSMLLREGDSLFLERKTAQTSTELGAGYFVYYYELIGDITLT